MKIAIVWYALIVLVTFLVLPAPLQGAVILSDDFEGDSGDLTGQSAVTGQTWLASSKVETAGRSLSTGTLFTDDPVGTTGAGDAPAGPDAFWRGNEIPIGQIVNDGTLTLSVDLKKQHIGGPNNEFAISLFSSTQNRETAITWAGGSLTTGGNWFEGHSIDMNFSTGSVRADLVINLDDGGTNTAALTYTRLDDPQITDTINLGSGIVGTLNYDTLFVTGLTRDTKVIGYDNINLDLQGIVAGPDREWNNVGGAPWPSGPWTDGTPGPDNRAIFGGNIQGDATITVDGSDVTVNAIRFDNATDSYAVAGNASVNLSSGALGDPEVEVLSGSHQFQAAVNFNGNSSVTAGDGTTLDFNNVINLGANDLTIDPASGGAMDGIVNINNTVSGTGTLTNNATLATASSTSVGGNLTSGGTLDFDITPNSAGQFNVSGSASLDGTINVDFLDGETFSSAITLVTSSSPIVLPGGGVGDLTLNVTGESGLSLALGGGGTTLLLTSSAGVVGDYDDSTQVAQGDLDIVLLNWGTSNFPGNEANIPPGGGTFDGTVSQNELDGVLLNWGNTSAAGAATAVPEPGGLLLLVVAFVGFLGRFRSSGVLDAKRNFLV